jgi:hypothetical protein
MPLCSWCPSFRSNTAAVYVLCLVCVLLLVLSVCGAFGPVGAGFSQSLILLLEDYSFPHTFITLLLPPSLSEGSFGILLRGQWWACRHLVVHERKLAPVMLSPRWWLRMPCYDKRQLKGASPSRPRKLSVAVNSTCTYACFCFSTWFQPGWESAR